MWGEGRWPGGRKHERAGAGRRGVGRGGGEGLVVLGAERYMTMAPAPSTHLAVDSHAPCQPCTIVAVVPHTSMADG